MIVYKKQLFSFLILSIFVLACQALTNAIHQPVGLDWPDGDIIFISDRIYSGSNLRGWDGPLYFLDIEQKDWFPIQNSRNSSLGIAPSWSPDHQQIAFVDSLASLNGRQGTVLLDVNGTREVFGDSIRAAVTWSPDGQMIAYYEVSTSSKINLVIAHGLNKHQIIATLPDGLFDDKLSPDNVRLAWSPDGQYLAYDNLDENGQRAIWLVSLTEGIPRQLLLGSHPAWSPTRNEIAFDRDGDIWIIDLEEKTERKLADEPRPNWLYSGWPAWSPDGQQLAFVNTREGNAEIYLINRDGTDLTNLTNHPSYDAFPIWRPK